MLGYPKKPKRKITFQILIPNTHVGRRAIEEHYPMVAFENHSKWVNEDMHATNEGPLLNICHFKGLDSSL